MNACEFTMSITALANAVANTLDDDQLALLAATLTQLGDTLATIAVQREYSNKLCHSGSFGVTGKSAPVTQEG